MRCKLIISIASVFLPWKIRRYILTRFLGYEIHPTSWIGLSWIFPKHLIMEAHATIGHLTVCKGVENLILREHAIIGRGNWISGVLKENSKFYTHQTDRIPQLILKRHAAITNRHLIDCTNTVVIGEFTTFAGFKSQILTHSIDIYYNRQSSAPIIIGDYCFIGTDCVLLGGAVLPNYSILGAKSLLNKPLKEEYCLYCGVPAINVKKLSTDIAYFNRKVGYVI
jgi:acetyltransferase-like isoleucine patch superfamily enzyme